MDGGSFAAAEAFWHSATSGVTLYTFQTTATATIDAADAALAHANDEAIHLG